MDLSQALTTKPQTLGLNSAEIFECKASMMSFHYPRNIWIRKWMSRVFEVAKNLDVAYVMYQEEELQPPGADYICSIVSGSLSNYIFAVTFQNASIVLTALTSEGFLLNYFFQGNDDLIIAHDALEYGECRLSLAVCHFYLCINQVW